MYYIFYSLNTDTVKEITLDDEAPSECWNTDASHFNDVDKIWQMLHKDGKFDKYAPMVIDFIVELFADEDYYLAQWIIINPSWDNTRISEDLKSAIKKLVIDTDNTQKHKIITPQLPIKSTAPNVNYLSQLRNILGDSEVLRRLLFDSNVCSEGDLHEINNFVRTTTSSDSIPSAEVHLPDVLWCYVSFYLDRSSLMKFSEITSLFMRLVNTKKLAKKHHACRRLKITNTMAEKFIKGQSSTYLFKGMQDLHISLDFDIFLNTQLPFFTAINVKRYVCNGNFRMAILPPAIEKIIVNFTILAWGLNLEKYRREWDKVVKESFKRKLKLFMLTDDYGYHFRHIPEAETVLWQNCLVYSSLLTILVPRHKIRNFILLNTTVTADYLFFSRLPSKKYITSEKSFYFINDSAFIDWEAVSKLITNHDMLNLWFSTIVIKCTIIAANYNHFLRFLDTLIYAKTKIGNEIDITVIVDCKSDDYKQFCIQQKAVWDRFIEDRLYTWTVKRYEHIMENNKIKSLKIGGCIEGVEKESAGYMFDIKKIITEEQLKLSNVNFKHALYRNKDQDIKGQKFLIEEWNAILKEIYKHTE